MYTTLMFLSVWFFVSIPVTFFIGAVFSLSKDARKQKKITPSLELYHDTL